MFFNKRLQKLLKEAANKNFPSLIHIDSVEMHCQDGKWHQEINFLRLDEFSPILYGQRNLFESKLVNIFSRGPY